MSMLLVIFGSVGAYGFATEGVSSPVVWAVSGKLAPFAWLSIAGFITLVELNIVNKSETNRTEG